MCRRPGLKQAGTVWLPEHADQIAYLRVLRVSDQWLSHWNYPHPLLEGVTKAKVTNLDFIGDFEDSA